ncbi:MAG: AAA family ATPase [Acidobacteriia bacterium]|nr:AAA family ATPase [Terriglobia bacterium]
MPSSALEYITIKGFKSIRSVEKLKLRPINVLIGPNGSGKSNFIGVFAFLHALGEGRLRDFVAEAGGAEKLLHFGSKITKEICFGLSMASGTECEFKLSPSVDDSLYLSHESANWILTPDSDAEYGDPTGEGIPQWLRDHSGRWRVYHVHDTSSSSPMRKTARVDDNDFLRPDGSNLAAFLYYLREKRGASYSLIQRTVQRVAPFFEDFQLKPLKLKPDDIKLEWRHKRSDQYFDASSLSDGTLRFIALATLFLQPEEGRPSLILVDEPELGLHPLAIEILASVIRQASVSSQVIVSTQSSLLLDYFEPQDVLVADRVEGGTQITRLDRPDLATWLEEYSLGQLWEKNELGGRPVPD